ncbi:MAG: S8 family serine peptidase [Ignavibacteriaceae bacterium]|nr:S8 family serine peptidase [Ignavibacteriaceae bacterium]
MKINNLFFILFVFTAFKIFSQEVYFVKFTETADLLSLNIFIQDSYLSIYGNKVFPLNEISINEFAKGKAKKIPSLKNIIKISFPSNTTDIFWSNFKKKYPAVEYIQKQTIYKVDSVPNDSLISQQWALPKIDAFNAWNITEGSDSIIIGVIDTGIDFFHPDLIDNIYINKGEIGFDNLGNDKKSNGIDDDGNGFIDDYQGWDFTDRTGFPFDSTGGDYLNWDNYPMDENTFSHGTSVAGIIAASTNNGKGIAGVAPKVKVMNLRAFDPDGYGEEDDVAAALLYAIANGVKVINMSFGDTSSYSYVLRDVIRYAYSNNVVMVASSGNDHATSLHYPSSYDEVISVGSSTQEDFVASYSSYGSTLDLVAPGEDIMTTARKSSYASFGGTSAAAPFVSAAAGLILSQKTFSNEEIKQIIKSTCDDINTSGWDIKSGAGRLNVFKALITLAPSIVKFDYPQQDFATAKDSVNISVTVLSPFFENFDLMFGVGLNPDSWRTILTNQKNQIYNQKVGSIDLHLEKDTVFTLRIVLHQTNGLTKEERINIRRITKLPQGELISIFPAYYGDKPTFVAAIYSTTPAITKMYYRKSNTNDSYKYISLDGFATNNLFVKQLHYGFIPKGIVEPNSDYQIYFEVENQLGNSVKLLNNGNPFLMKSNDYFHLQGFEERSYSLPPGSIYESPFILDSTNANYLFLRENSNAEYTSLYKYESDNFIKIDSLPQRIPKVVGDFNRNGKVDVLALWARNGFIMEQKEKNSTKFDDKQSFDKSMFWPIFAQDVDGDSIYEIGALTSDSTISIYKVNYDLSLTLSQTLNNFSPSSIYGNEINSPHCVIADLNKNGTSELWFLDREGDIFSYELNSANKFVPYLSASTGFECSSNQITAGDFDNDGVKELAVLVHSIPEIDIASFHILEILKLDNSVGNDPKLSMIFSNAFVDPAEEFGSSFQKKQSALKFITINTEEKLVLFAFPYSYILSNNSINSSTDFIYFDETTNSNSIFTGYLSSNSLNDIAFPKADKIKFLTFSFSLQNIPTDLIGYTLDSSSIYLKWSGSNNYTVYRGNIPDVSTFVQIGSTNSNHFIDTAVSLNNKYYYAVKNNPPLQQNYSAIVEVYHHNAAKLLEAKTVSSLSIEIKFSEKIKTVVENLEAFRLLNSNGNSYPHSASPSSSFSYLITFPKEFAEGENELVIKDLFDFYNSPIEIDTVGFNYNVIPTKNKFYIANHTILSPYKINLQFNLKVDTLSVLKSSNYLVEPANPITSISLSDDKSVIINFKNRIGSIGKEYKLICMNIFSDNLEGSLPIEEGAGSEVILLAKAEGLENVFIYPSPAKISGGNVTFANLPQYAEILIYSLSGNKINHIFETDGNGGLSWDFRDLNGNTVNTGVYLFMIKQLDGNKNELGRKLGKLAVIK